MTLCELASYTMKLSSLIDGCVSIKSSSYSLSSIDRGVSGGPYE